MVVNPWVVSWPYATFVPDSLPPRQEGMAAKNFITSHCLFKRFFASLLPKIAPLICFDEAKLKTSLHLCKFFKEISKFFSF